MKAITKIRMAVLLGAMAISAPVFSNNGGNEKAPITNTAEEKAKVEVMINRIKEIRDMDKSDLTRVERKALRKEVREIKTALKASNNGVYLSVGAIIIIILLLILIL